MQKKKKRNIKRLVEIKFAHCQEIAKNSPHCEQNKSRLAVIDWNEEI